MNQEGIDHLRLGLNLDQVIAQARTRLRLTDRDNFLHAQTRHRIDGRWMLHRLRSEEHTSELQSLMRISYAVFCLQKKKNNEELFTLTAKSTSVTQLYYTN